MKVNRNNPFRRPYTIFNSLLPILILHRLYKVNHCHQQQQISISLISSTTPFTNITLNSYHQTPHFKSPTQHKTTKMAITITTCAHCTSDVQKRLNAMRLPHEMKRNGSKTIFKINIASQPSTWTEKEQRSLTAMCWRSIQFTYHQAVRNGNKLSCSSAR